MSRGAGDTNYKGEAYPDDPNALMVRIGQKCRTVFDDYESFALTDIYGLDATTGKVTFLRRFRDQNAGLFRDGKEIKGLYILSERRVPFYVGISQTILRRIRQHFFSLEHNQASLIYLMATKEYRRKHGVSFGGLRKDFPMQEYGAPIQEQLRKSARVTIAPVDDSFELHLSEAYYACHYRTYWNTFETH